MNSRTQVILVDEHDRPVGVADKLAVHQPDGRLHRAFSVFLFNSRGELLLQRRAVGKYHFGGLWTNSCCSHPAPGESVLDAAQRRLRQELGLEAPLADVGWFIYRALDTGSGLAEHELDHVLLGTSDATPTPAAAEVDAWCWCAPAEVDQRIAERPAEFTPWLPLAIDHLRSRGLWRPGNG